MRSVLVAVIFLLSLLPSVGMAEVKHPSHVQSLLRIAPHMTQNHGKSLFPNKRTQDFNHLGKKRVGDLAHDQTDQAYRLSSQRARNGMRRISKLGCSVAHTLSCFLTDQACITVAQNP